MEILGNNLKKFFDVVDSEYTDAEITYAGRNYEVWEVSDVLFKFMCAMSEEEFVEVAGENAWWRSSEGSILGIPNEYFSVNGECLIGWNRWDRETTRYTNLSEYLCDCVGVSQPKNVCACCMDLSKYNNMTMAELFEKYGE